MTEDRAKHLAFLCQAIDDAEGERKEFMKDWAARYQTLLNQRYRLQNEILSGQLSLVPEEPKAS